MKIYKYQMGATLIEIAITVLLLSTALLALATMQTRSLQFNQSSFMRSQANIYVYDIIDRIRINRGVNSINIVGYNTDYDGSPSGNTLATSDVAEWRTNLKRSLPDGKGKIECNAGSRVCRVSIKWSEEQMFGGQDIGGQESSTEFVYSSSI